jgi:hypothetical protein
MFTLFKVVSIALALASSALATPQGSPAPPVTTVPLTFDTAYDNAGQSLATVSCSDGPNGLLTKGFTTFKSLPNFPNIGGASVIPGFNSPNCGTCWTLTFQNNSLNVLAIDHADAGFNIGLTANNKLTGGAGVFFGTVQITAVEASPAACGL